MQSPVPPVAWLAIAGCGAGAGFTMLCVPAGGAVAQSGAEPAACRRLRGRHTARAVALGAPGWRNRAAQPVAEPQPPGAAVSRHRTLGSNARRGRPLSAGRRRSQNCAHAPLPARRSRIAFSASPGFAAFARLGTAWPSDGRASPTVGTCSLPPPVRYACAPSPPHRASIELEWVFFSVTPTAVQSIQNRTCS